MSSNEFPSLTPAGKTRMTLDYKALGTGAVIGLIVAALLVALWPTPSADISEIATPPEGSSQVVSDSPDGTPLSDKTIICRPGDQDDDPDCEAVNSSEITTPPTVVYSTPDQILPDGVELDALVFPEGDCLTDFLRARFTDEEFITFGTVDFARMSEEQRDRFPDWIAATEEAIGECGLDATDAPPAPTTTTMAPMPEPPSPDPQP